MTTQDKLVPSRRGVALAFLFVICASNFLDRSIVNVLGELIRAEMQLTNAMLGLVTGFGFAMLYAVFSIPIARLAERVNRIGLITVCLVVWSVMTVLCGLAAGPMHLFLARLGVGVGEAGFQPAANSVIGDLYEPERRSGALSIYTFGGSVGVVIGALGVGAIAEHVGWRGAFLIAGAPGLLIAVLFYLFVKEPPRGAREGAGAAAVGATPTPLMELIVRLAKSPVFIHLLIATTLATFVMYGMRQFIAPFYMHGFGISLSSVGFALALISGLGGGVGVLLGGHLADRVGRRSREWRAAIPASGLALAVPLFVTAFLADSFALSLACLTAATLCQTLFLAPTLGLVHNMVGPRERASTIAVMFFVVNLIAIGLGPVTSGTLIDWLSAHAYAPDPGRFVTECVRTAGAIPAPACKLAAGEGASTGLALFALINLWSVAHYLLAFRALRTCPAT